MVLKYLLFYIYSDISDCKYHSSIIKTGSYQIFESFLNDFEYTVEPC